MIIAVHQPNYLPWLGFFYKMRKVDTLVLLDTVQFSKNSIQNRNKIKTPQGPLWVTVPVLTKGKFMQKTLDVEVNNQVDWKAKTQKTIALNYAKSAFFKDYMDEFFAVYQKDWMKLADVCSACIRFMAEKLSITTPLVRASELHLAPSSNASEMLIRICNHYNATRYFSGIGAQSYMDETVFRQHGVEIVYSDFKHPVYPQPYGDFMSHLSAIDLLFNCGKESGKILESAHA